MPNCRARALTCRRSSLFPTGVHSNRKSSESDTSSCCVIAAYLFRVACDPCGRGSSCAPTGVCYSWKRGKPDFLVQAHEQSFVHKAPTLTPIQRERRCTTLYGRSFYALRSSCGLIVVGIVRRNHDRLRQNVLGEISCLLTHDTTAPILNNFLRCDLCMR